MKIALFQIDIIWLKPDENIIRLEALIKGLEAGTDMAVLPEMFSTGFCTNPSPAIVSEGIKTIEWMRKASVIYNIALCGSVIYGEDNKIFNRFIAALPDGEIISYDKRHLFRMGCENNVFTRGEKRVTFTYKGIRFIPQICYDLRFPVWSRNRNDYDVMIYVANWPTARIETWKQLLLARAIENNCIAVGVNRIGTDGNNYEYSGNSLVADYRGKIITESTEPRQEILYAELNLSLIKDFRNKFQSWLDADEFDFR